MRNSSEFAPNSQSWGGLRLAPAPSASPGPTVRNIVLYPDASVAAVPPFPRHVPRITQLNFWEHLLADDRVNPIPTDQYIRRVAFAVLKMDSHLVLVLLEPRAVHIQPEHIRLQGIDENFMQIRAVDGDGWLAVFGFQFVGTRIEQRLAVVGADLRTFQL